MRIIEVPQSVVAFPESFGGYLRRVGCSHFGDEQNEGILLLQSPEMKQIPRVESGC